RLARPRGSARPGAGTVAGDYQEHRRGGGMSRACHKCKAIVPDNMLLCPVCVSTASDEAPSAQQLKFLPMIKTGQGSFRLHRSGNQPKHIAMFDIVNYLAFCGAYLGQSRGGHAWTY